MPETSKPNVFLFLAKEHKKHYEAMARLFPNEPIWKIALKDTKERIEQLET